MSVLTRQSTGHSHCHHGAIRPLRRAFVPLTREPPPESSPRGHILRTFNEMRDELVGILSSVLGNQEDAQDMAQEAFLRCWRNQDDLGGIRNMRAWIFRVALNAARDLQRSAWSRRCRPPLEDDLTPGFDQPPIQALEEQELLTMVRGALKRLRPAEQDVFLLRQNGELTYRQIARLRSRPVGTVKTLMRSALHKLREALNPIQRQ